MATVTLLGPKVSDRSDLLTSSSAELSATIQYDNSTSIFVLGLAHRNVARVARTTNVFDVMFRAMLILSDVISSC